VEVTNLIPQYNKPRLTYFVSKRRPNNFDF